MLFKLIDYVKHDKIICKDSKNLRVELGFQWNWGQKSKCKIELCWKEIIEEKPQIYSSTQDGLSFFLSYIFFLPLVST